MLERNHYVEKLRPLDVIVVMLVFLFIFAVVPVACHKSQTDTNRLKCSQNLSVIGKAMMNYANDFSGKLPRSGGINSHYAPEIEKWNGADRFEAFDLETDGNGGRASISSCFYLLVKYDYMTPKSIVCPGDSNTTEFKIADANENSKTLVDLWDFGAFAFKHCSYSFHMPFSFSIHTLTTAFEPGMAVAADRNPWIRSPAAKEKLFPGNFKPDGDREAVKAGNSISHQEEGQNVLFLDNHVNFEKRSFCGIDNDNIYTYWHDGDIRMGQAPRPVADPSDKKHSLLIHDPPSGGPPRPTRGPGKS